MRFAGTTFLPSPSSNIASNVIAAGELSALCCCALFTLSMAGCTALLDTGSLSNGYGAGGDNGGAYAEAGAGPAGGAGSSGVAGSTPRGGGSAQGGSAGGSGSGTTGGTANSGGGGTTGMAGASAGAGGAPCTKTNGGKETCDGVDNDCDAATPDCPAGCSSFAAYAVNYMACAKLANWSSAELACLQQTMQLAQIFSAQENDAVSAKLRELELPGHVWIGGESDPRNDTTFKWVNNTVIYQNGKAVAGVYQNFASNQPASLAAPSDLQIDPSAGTWSNALPSTSQPYVCKAFSFK